MSSASDVVSWDATVPTRVLVPGPGDPRDVLFEVACFSSGHAKVYSYHGIPSYT
jgi:hypothetical protein